MAAYNEETDTWTLSVEEMQELNTLAIFKDLEIEKRKEAYPMLVHKIRAVCRLHGYALGVHGSEVRDIDLIACPWVSQPSAPELLVEAIMRNISALKIQHGKGWNEPEEKPHGRVSYLFTTGGATIIDLSIMPRRGY